jgi:Predicted dehydrogenases and related proteins
MMDKTKVCVVGMGRAGRLHAQNFAENIKNAELKAVVDPVEEIAKEAGKEFGVPCYKSLEDALEKEDFDAVIICTPSFTHLPLIVEAAEHGKHILCEKPLTLTLEDADRALRATAKVKLQVGYMRRFDRYYREAKERIEKGEIGEPLIFTTIAKDPFLPAGWTGDPSKSGGIFLDMLSHDFDTARWLMGKEVKEVCAKGGNWIYGKDFDCVSVILEFEKGIGTIDGCRKCCYGYDLRTEVTGSGGTIFVNSPIDANLAVGNNEGIRPKQAQWFWERFKNAFFEEDLSFVDCIQKDKEVLVTGMDGKRALEIALAAKISAEAGKFIKSLGGKNGRRQICGQNGQNMGAYGSSGDRL